MEYVNVIKCTQMVNQKHKVHQMVAEENALNMETMDTQNNE
jgi:hypothetical protein